MGEITLHVVAFVSAWNKKTMSIQNKEEYNALARMKEKYNVSQLKKLYEINLIKYLLTQVFLKVPYLDLFFLFYS